MTSNKVILVLIAMEAEAKPFIDELKLTEILPSPAPCRTYAGVVGKSKIVVVTNGKDVRHLVDNVGTTPAAISTYVSIQTHNPDIVINAGTAGGFNRVNGKIGDVYVCNYFTHHDRRIPIPGFEDYGKGLHKCVDTLNLANELKFKTGTATTSNSLDHTSTDDEIMLANDAHIKDMESASIAWVIENCFNTTHTNDDNKVCVPFFAIKVITDIVDGDRPTHEEFMENLHVASVSLQSALLKTITFLDNKTISEL